VVIVRGHVPVFLSSGYEVSSMSAAVKQYENFQALAKGTNVNEVTLLATDYLNHFNEALMLAELVADMPDMLDEFLAWQPKHYKDHFRDSGVADKDLAIQAFDWSPLEYKEPFESIVAKLNKQLEILQKNLKATSQGSGKALSPDVIQKKCTLIRTLIDFAGGVINGNLDSSNQESVDRVFTESDAINRETSEFPSAQTRKVVEPELAETFTPAAEQDDVEVEIPSELAADSEHEMDQSEIDALFD
jgi:hypothetical protein